MIRVLLVDDHAFVRDSVSLLLQQAGGIEVVGECEDGAAVLPLAWSTAADVVLMDIRMPGTDGVDATRVLMAERPSSRVLIFSAAANETELAEARRLGAMGYVMKDGDSALLVDGIRTVASGGTFWSKGCSVLGDDLPLPAE